MSLWFRAKATICFGGRVINRESCNPFHAQELVNELDITAFMLAFYSSLLPHHRVDTLTFNSITEIDTA